MQHAPIKMIALDLDGTLALANHQVSPRTATALETIHNEGVEIVIATGRRYRTTRFVIENLGFEVCAVCNGGALVKMHTGETLHESTIPSNEIACIMDVARHLGLQVTGQRDSHDRGGADFVIDNAVDWHRQTQSYYDANAAWCEIGDITTCADELLVLGIFNDFEPLAAFVAELQQQCPDRFNTILVPHLDTGYYYCEINQSHVSKWHGLDQLAQQFACDHTNICAVGDQLNDLAMVQAVKHGVAMGNGADELKAAAMLVCGANDQDGLLDVVDYVRNFNTSLAL